MSEALDFARAAERFQLGDTEPPEDVQRLRDRLASLLAACDRALTVRAVTTAVLRPDVAERYRAEWVDYKELRKRTGRSVRWIREHGHTLPGYRKIGERVEWHWPTLEASWQA
jgi:hypothetical protein